jgi:hypothetical protein
MYLKATAFLLAIQELSRVSQSSLVSLIGKGSFGLKNELGDVIKTPSEAVTRI